MSERFGPEEGNERPRALLVDDDEIVRRICRRALEQAGFDVQEAADGVRGIALLAEIPFVLVVSDHRMPGATGVEVLTVASLLRPTARRVLMSSTLDPETIERARGVAHAWFEKTGALVEFRARLHEHAIAPRLAEAKAPG